LKNFLDRINNSYEILTNKDKREAYLREIKLRYFVSQFSIKENIDFEIGT